LHWHTISMLGSICVVWDINPWNSCLYRCTVRYFMGLVTLQHRLIVVLIVVLQSLRHYQWWKKVLVNLSWYTVWVTLIIVLVSYWPRLIFSCDLLYLPKFIYGQFKVICIKEHQNILLNGVFDDILGAWINKNIRVTLIIIVLVLYWPRLIFSCDVLYLPKFISGLFKVICI
jgi:hypothetical protein